MSCLKCLVIRYQQFKSMIVCLDSYAKYIFMIYLVGVKEYI